MLKRRIEKQESQSAEKSGRTPSLLGALCFCHWYYTRANADYSLLLVFFL